ncbi:DUF3232 domain-containing protein [Faecalibacillus faecis]|uniref:DUF3232 domain-containing protein n=1 Tax=Faecalibacillus faecis TaxID=1982628 RepID=UPI00386B6D73
MCKITEYASITNLITILQKADENDCIDFINETLSQMERYVKLVNEMERTINIAKFRMEPEDFRITVQNLDTQRRNCHESIIVGVKAMNRMCNEYKIDLVFAGDIDDRWAIGEYAGTIVHQIFENRK